MKKVISVLLALIMIVGLLSTAAFAEEEKTDTISFNSSNYELSKNGYFELKATCHDSDGWYGGQDDTITISAKYKNLTITRIETKITCFAHLYGEVGVSKGTKQPDCAMKNGDTVTVVNINAPMFSYTGGALYSQFKEFTIYYTGTPINPIASIFSQGNIWIVAGIAVVAAGTVAALVITKKKKPAAANTEK